MFDFPNAPVLNQQVLEPNGAVLRWDGVKWVNAAGQVSSVTPAYNNVGRNLLHNALFNVAQRGIGPFTTHNAYTADRWRLGTALDTVSIARNTAQSFADAVGDDAARNYLTVTFTGNAGAGATTYIDQPIEGVSRLGGKTVAISFWANCSPVLKLGINLVQVFGTGGSPSSAAYVQATGNAVTLSGTITRYTTTFTIPPLAGKTLGTNGDDHTLLRLLFTSGANANATSGNIGVQSGTINLWGVQLEVGGVATPLEKPDPQQDLAKCQRFYQTVSLRFVGYQAAGAGFGAAQSLLTTMRAVPTVVPTYTTQTNCTGGILALDAATFSVNAIATALGVVVLTGSCTASADL
jgi:hypothetical protein